MTLIIELRIQNIRRSPNRNH